MLCGQLAVTTRHGCDTFATTEALTAYSCAHSAQLCTAERSALQSARELPPSPVSLTVTPMLLAFYVTSCSNTPQLGTCGSACSAHGAQGARAVLGARPQRRTAHPLPAGCLPFALAAAAAAPAASLLPAAGA